MRRLRPAGVLSKSTSLLFATHSLSLVVCFTLAVSLVAIRALPLSRPWSMVANASRCASGRFVSIASSESRASQSLPLGGLGSWRGAYRGPCQLWLSSMCAAGIVGRCRISLEVMRPGQSRTPASFCECCPFGRIVISEVS